MSQPGLNQMGAYVFGQVNKKLSIVGWLDE
mgnify:FL=1|jgi:hypothetical protein